MHDFPDFEMKEQFLSSLSSTLCLYEFCASYH